MATRPELPHAAVPMQIAADDEIDLTAADAGNYCSPMAVRSIPIDRKTLPSPRPA
jgi:hypothetical protein